MQQTKETISKPTWHFHVGRVISMAVLLLISFRVAALPFILLWGFEPKRHANGYGLAVMLALILTLASPVDIGVPGLARLRGNRQSGTRLVRVVMGMPKHTELVARYGEYVSTGCGGLPCVYQPKWWVVWW